MHSNKSIIKIFVIIFILSFSFANVFALSWSQKTTINNNRGGKINLTYWTATSDLKDGFYKSLPFTEDKIKSVFSSANNTVESVNIKKFSDSTLVNIAIGFKDIQKINTASGFSNAKVTWFKGEDSITFMYKLDKITDFSSASKISYVFVLPAKEIFRTSGVKDKDNSVVYGLNSERMANGAEFFVIFNSTDDSSGKQTSDSGNKESGKGCGLFGIELPLIFFSGLFMMFASRKNKKYQK